MVVRKRLQLTGPAVVFITTTVKEWSPIFASEPVALTALMEFQYTLRLYAVSALGYVLMPSHLHTILYFKEIERLSRFVQSFKGNCAKSIRDSALDICREQFVDGGRFQLWKPRFDDFIIRNITQFRTKLNYIHDNPVRAGLVSRPEDYRFSSANDWLYGVKGPIEICKELPF